MGVYENSDSKAEDHKSSAVTLLLIGIIGLIVIALIIAGIIPIHLYGVTKYMTYGIMGTLFIIFIIMGFVSMKSYKSFAKQAVKEHSVEDAMKEWCKSTFSADMIDQSALKGCSQDATEEEKYFNRTAFLKFQFKQEYPNLDETYLDHLLDELYEDIFES